jgi:L-asparaginase II
VSDPSPADASAAPVLIEVTRKEFVESRHRGRLVLLAADGSTEVSVGPVTAALYARSTLKPLQAVAMLDAGFAGSGPELALAAASHDGEPEHISGVRAALARAGLDERALQCPPALPMAPDAMVAWVRAGGAAAAVCHNCSGKHAAMLATCVVQGWPLDTYRAPDHPLQRAIRDRIETCTGAPVAATAVDGCGAPAFAVPLDGLARAFRAIATAPAGSQRAVAEAMRGYPELISGRTRAAAQLCREVPGLVAKDGAEGVWAAALPDGRAFAAKFDDGASRGGPPLLAAVLGHWGFRGPAVQRWSAVPTLGGGEPVGAITASPQLRALLAR